MTIAEPTSATRTAGRSRRPHVYHRNDDLADMIVPGGERDDWSIDAILGLLPALPSWPDPKYFGRAGDVGMAARSILDWLQGHPGSGWQQRWIASGADDGTDWLDTLISDEDPRIAKTLRAALTAGLSNLLLCRIVMPSYRFLAVHKSTVLSSHCRQVFRPDLFAAIETRARVVDIGGQRLQAALSAICKLVLHTGRDVDRLTAEDVLGLRAHNMRKQGHAKSGLALAWTLLGHVADLGPHSSLKDAVRYGQQPTADLVDLYDLQSTAVRHVLVRYLNERRPSLDYSTLTVLTARIVGRFWKDIERSHPGIDSLDLPEEVAQAWKQRLRTRLLPDGTTRPSRDYYAVLTNVRSFYKDLQEWAHEDPSWAQWAVRNPIRRSDTAGAVKEKKRHTAAMHQRIRERLPHLDVLVDAAHQYKNDHTALRAATKNTPVGEVFTHLGRDYRRVVPAIYDTRPFHDQPVPETAVDLDTGRRVDVGKAEHESFMAWAVIEVLRHTGVRIEELLEITHLALVSYRLPDTGEIVPMLQIVPSKSNEERLLLVSPELASVLASVISRLRALNGGSIPATARYDLQERTIGPTLPHLFQHRVGWAWEVPSPTTIQKWLTAVLARTGLVDIAGAPLHFTPHDFRRMFVTEAVGGGLPVHIVARLLGHRNINTTQTYTAVFDTQLVRSYRSFLDNRRAQRPEVEYRDPTKQEWDDFQQHFQLRKLELGECGRPYGTPCKHEHACIRCPSLRLDLQARPRLVEIIANLNDRVTEAKHNGWLGEVAGLNASLHEAARKLVSLDRTRDRRQASAIDLGIPVIESLTPTRRPG